MTLIRRLLAAGTLSFLICAGLLIWSAYRDRSDGVSLANAARVGGAVALVALAACGSRMRHQSPPQMGAD